MKCRVLAFALLYIFAASDAWAAMAHVQSNGTSGSGISVSLAYSSNNTAGNLLILRSATGSGTSASINGDCTDTAGNDWIQIPNATGGTVDHQALQYVKSAIGGANTVNCNFNASAGFFEFDIFEYSGQDQTAPLDKSSSNEQFNPGTATDAVTTGSQTPTTSGQLILSCTFRIGGSGSTTAAGTGWTMRQDVFGDSGCEEKIHTSGAIAGTWTADAADNDFFSSIVTFKAAAAAAAQKTLLMLGVQ